MRTKSVDVAIIGTGSAGMNAYRAAREHTSSLAVIEGGAYGTTCARVGCMPSKLLIAAAEAAHAVERAATFGVRTQVRQIDGRAVMARVRSERDRFVGFVTEAVEAYDPDHRLQGHARFVRDGVLEVGDHTRLEAKRVVLATGSSPHVPELLQGLGTRLVVNDDVFAWEDLPQAVAVFGPGAIGLELGQALHRLGVRVRLFGLSGHVGPLTDPKLVAYATRTFGAELALEAAAQQVRVEREQQGVHIRWSSEGAQHSEHFEYVLAAAGRRPNVHGLGLERTSLPLDEHGVPRFDPATLQAGSHPVFVAGDVTGVRLVLHEAADEGKTAGANAGRYPDVRAGHRRSPLSVVFSDPQIAIAGLSWQELHGWQQLQAGRGHDCQVAAGEVSFEDQGRSRVMARNRGLLRVYAEHGSGHFLGAEMIAPDAEHLGHLLAWAHQRALRVQDMLELVFYHPVVEEGVRTALRDLNRALRFGPGPSALDCGPGA